MLKRDTAGAFVRHGHNVSQAWSRTKGRRHGFLLSHWHLFLLGWSYYLVAPLTGVWLGMFEAGESFEMMERYIDNRTRWWPALAAFVLLMPCMYALGMVAGNVFKQPQRRPQPAFRLDGNRLLLPLYTLLFAVFTWTGRDYMFTGYVEGVEQSVVGPMATLEMALLFQYLANRRSSRLAARWGGILLLLNSVALLGMGGRLYVLSSLVALYFYWWRWEARSNAHRLRSLAWVLATPVALALLGMWRLDAVDFSALGFYLFAESFFTAISLFSLMLGGSWNAVDVPMDFVSGFLNIVPSSVWPGKLDAMTSLLDSHLNLESPFGALSIVASAVGNFGLIPGLLFFSFVGFFMALAANRTRSPVGKAFYCFLSGMLPFLFFRDPFPIQIKLVVTGLILYAINHALMVRKPPSQSSSVRGIARLRIS